MTHLTLFFLFSELFFWVILVHSSYHIYFRNRLSISRNHLAVIWIRIVLTLDVELKIIDFLTVLSLPMHEHDVAFCLFRIALILSSVLYSFPRTDPAHILLDLCPSASSWRCNCKWYYHLKNFKFQLSFAGI